MNSNHMLLTLGALGILSLLVLNANRAVLNNTRVVYTGQFTNSAIAIAQSYLQEITAKEFDENVIGQPVIRDSTRFKLTQGPDFDEHSVSAFDDIGDYNGYTATAKIPNDTASAFGVTCTVDYVNASNFDEVMPMQTFYKKVTVVVTIPNADPSVLNGAGTVPSVKLSSVVAYH